MSRNNIILIGYRGTGKSAVGNFIANQENKKYLSTDELIVERVGSINKFVDQNGWDKFRQIEHEIIANIDTENAVIDCGGGVIEIEENYKPLSELGPIFWLKATAATIFARIKDSSDRPALSDSDFLSEIPTILERRIPLYKNFADYEIRTDNRKIEEIATEIITNI